MKKFIHCLVASSVVAISGCETVSTTNAGAVGDTELGVAIAMCTGNVSACCCTESVLSEDELEQPNKSAASVTPSTLYSENRVNWGALAILVLQACHINIEVWSGRITVAE